MERAGKTLAKSGALTTDELACAAWVAAVGKRIASHAAAKTVVRGSLIVEVDDAVWQKQLFHLRFQILGKLSEVVGAGVIQDLEFRMATPRRPPQPAQRLQEKKASSTDDADRIEDVGMRIVYKQARNKASA
jgi:predicted nucleic acid-binding Zn ribbon protein